MDNCKQEEDTVKRSNNPWKNEIKRSIISWQIKAGINEITDLSFIGNSTETKPVTKTQIQRLELKRVE